MGTAVFPRRTAGERTERGRKIGHGIVAHILCDHGNRKVGLLQQTFGKIDPLLPDEIVDGSAGFLFKKGGKIRRGKIHVGGNIIPGNLQGDVFVNIGFDIAD